ncbi:hypothetical protein BVY03_03160 [bacterium K02(2017)]|nr:hypothetical protein BVY03_03160 [bacterium K02(2017)]
MQNTKNCEQNKTFLKGLRTVSFIEGCSTLILFFIAMPLKYLMDITNAVSWPGRIHGGLFVLLVVLAFVAIKKISISPKLSFMIIVAAVIPFGPFIIDKKLKAISITN